MTKKSPSALFAPPARHVRALIPADLHDRIAHLAVDLHATIGDLLVEGLVLLCRYHDVGAGLPEPMAPKSSMPKIVRLQPVPRRAEGAAP
jgi:hypothetical protein